MPGNYNLRNITLPKCLKFKCATIIICKEKWSSTLNRMFWTPFIKKKLKFRTWNHHRKNLLILKLMTPLIRLKEADFILQISKAHTTIHQSKQIADKVFLMSMKKIHFYLIASIWICLKLIIKIKYHGLTLIHILIAFPGTKKIFLKWKI